MKPPIYITPPGQTCPECEDECEIIPNLNDFDHEFGTHYPQDWGDPVSNCCEAHIENAEEG